jgi:hypothetical protein
LKPGASEPSYRADSLKRRKEEKRGPAKLRRRVFHCTSLTAVRSYNDEKVEEWDDDRIKR